MKKLLTLVLFVFLAAVFVAMGVLVLPAYKRHAEMVALNESLKKELRAKENKRIELRKRLNDLQTDKGEIEKVAREKFNFCKEGEKIYKFNQEPAPPGEDETP